MNPARKTRPQAPRLPEFSFEKRQALEGSSTVGSLPSGNVISSENQINEGLNMLIKKFCLLIVFAFNNKSIIVLDKNGSDFAACVYQVLL